MSILSLGLADGVPGRATVAASVGFSTIYCLVAAWGASGLAGGNAAAIGVALAWFVIALGIWVVGFTQAAIRSAKGDEIAVASLFFLQGSAPKQVRIRLLAICVAVLGVTIATLGTNPVGFLVNMLPIGFCGLWGARHGTYPERTDNRRSRSKSDRHS